MNEFALAIILIEGRLENGVERSKWKWSSGKNGKKLCWIFKLISYICVQWKLVTSISDSS